MLPRIVHIKPSRNRPEQNSACNPGSSRYNLYGIVRSHFGLRSVTLTLELASRPPPAGVPAVRELSVPILSPAQPAMSAANSQVRMTKAQKKNARKMANDAAEAVGACSSGTEEPSAGGQRVRDAPGGPTPEASPAAMPSAPSASSDAPDPTNAGSLFIICFEALLWALLTVPGASLTIYAYADDIAIILDWIFRNLPRLAAIFGRWEAAASMALNVRKSAFLHLWASLSKFRFQSHVEQAVPLWSAIPIVDSFTYLGVLVGPHAASSRWEAPLRAYSARSGLLCKIA